MKVRKMRLLRHKHHISLVELSDACGVSKQRLSEIELDKTSVSEVAVQMITAGFSVVEKRRRDSLNALSRDFRRHKDTLLENVEEHGYEL